MTRIIVEIDIPGAAEEQVLEYVENAVTSWHRVYPQYPHSSCGVVRVTLEEAEITIEPPEIVLNLPDSL